jgi:hypothetical protein
VLVKGRQVIFGFDKRTYSAAGINPGGTDEG